MKGEIHNLATGDRVIYEMPDCRCAECGAIHSEFISQFGRWPEMTHADAQALKARRLDNEASWDRMMRGRS